MKKIPTIAVIGILIKLKTILFFYVAFAGKRSHPELSEAISRPQGVMEGDLNEGVIKV